MEAKLVTPRTAPPPEEFDEDELNLAEYIHAVWRHRVAIVAGILAVGLAVFVLSWLMKPTYEATARLAVSASKIADTPVGSMTALVPYYKAVLESPAVAQTVVDRFQLNNPPYNLSAGRLLEERISVEIERDANIIVAKSRFQAPDLAANVVNQLVDEGIAMAVRLSQGEAVASRDQLKTEVDQAEQRMKDADRRRESFKQTSQVEVAREEVDSMLAERAGLLPLLIHIQGERARLTAAREQLAARQAEVAERRRGNAPPTRTPPPRPNSQARGIDGQRSAEDRRATDTQDDGRLATTIKKEYVDIATETLENEIAATEARLTGLDKQKRDLASSQKLTPADTQKLNELYAKEAEMEQLQTASDLARESYVTVATRYEQARTQVLERSAQLQILHRAIPPERPISPRPIRYTAIAMALAAVIAVVLAVIVEVLRRPAPSHPRSV